ncbi:hypothetical protein NPIL_96721 [Nephila pilipes]|uniref:Spider venom protein n=1 Tax=Nephila pilipes TaxID=299642 RepID=A0A8X6IRZ8_NEPPI|nr:hypothetical protein NPIL_96721 [Nephila pilipes]
MTSVYLPLCLLVVFALVSLPCNAQFGMFKRPQQISPLIPTDDEIEICETLAEENDLILMNTEKVRKKTCEVVCKFSDESTLVHNSPKDTPCCDLAGIGPTGICDGNGKCNMMGMKGMKE